MKDHLTLYIFIVVHNCQTMVKKGGGHHFSLAILLFCHLKNVFV